MSTRTTIDTPVGRIRADGPMRLIIDFYDAAGLLEFVDEIRRLWPEQHRNADAFVWDSLDTRPKSTTVIMRNARDRVPGTSLREALGMEPVVEYPE